MQTQTNNERTARSGFTLVEMLTVVAIIAILAGLILSAVTNAKKEAMKRIAQSEMANLKGAIIKYEADYSIYPTTVTNGNNDVTFGTAHITGVTYTGPAKENSDVLDILRNVDPATHKGPNGHPRNPRHVVYIEPKPAISTDSPGVDVNGVYRDPWGSPYIISLDTSFNDIAEDPVYNPGSDIKSSVLIWSLGPDKRANGDKSHGDNKDNVLGWR